MVKWDDCQPQESRMGWIRTLTLGNLHEVVDGKSWGLNLLSQNHGWTLGFNWALPQYVEYEGPFVSQQKIRKNGLKMYVCLITF
jgi:hypothetical protein